MTGVGIALRCGGCGAVLGTDEPYPFRCPAAVAGDDVDHVVRRILPPEAAFPVGDDPNPFVRYRDLFLAHAVARSHGMSDDDYVALVRSLDDRVAAVDGTGFRVTPFGEHAALSLAAGCEPPGALWVKDETGNVSGSHKGRHLMGLLIWLDVVERVGLVAGGDRPLAIASCGNAALAAGVLARAAGRHLDVFVPTWAEEPVVRRLEELGAAVHVVPRKEGNPGDPTHHRLQEAIAEGAIPFTCQGSDNGLTIEGGLTLGYEIADELRRSGEGLDRITIQVGGGALASAVIQGLEEAVAMDALRAMPSVDTVQTEGGWPLARAYDLVAGAAIHRLEAETGDAPRSAARADVAACLRGIAGGRAAVAEELATAARHRSAFMWPWETEPHSVASGILDDETYDWVAVLGGMFATDGVPYVVPEELLLEANAMARETTGVDVDPTGSAGLAGLWAARRQGAAPPTQRAAVLFTGRRR
ncbi:MAG: pyridoxal-phosphate dependent enzyme [Actinomycetota bacterium]